jgi:integrase
VSSVVTPPAASPDNTDTDTDAAQIQATVQATLEQLGLGPASLALAGVKQTKSADTLFEESLAARTLSDRTQKRYRGNWQEFRAYLDAHCDGRDPVQALHEDIVAYVAHLKSKNRVMPDSAGRLRPHPLSVSSIRGILGCLAGFYQTCIVHRQRHDDPTRGIKRQRSKKVVGPTLNDDEVRRLLDARGSARCRVQAFLLLFTAARCESLRFLLWENVDFFNDEIHFDVAKGDNGYTVPMHPELKAALFRWRGEQEKEAAKRPDIAKALADPETAYVLLTRNGRRLSHSTMSKQFKWRANRAGVRPHAAGAAVNPENKARVSTHTARRTVATALRRLGVDVAEVATLLNDSVQVVVDHYAASSTEKQRKVVAQLRY